MGATAGQAMTRQRLVVVGNGMAGARTLEELLRYAPDLYDITVFGAESLPNYNRILISTVLAGEQAISEIILNDCAWYQRHDIRLHLQSRVTRLDRVSRRVVSECGAAADYDRLLLATGSSPVILPLPGKELEGVITYRDAQDTQRMIDAAARFPEAVVIGGGLLGLEAADGLKARGMQVTVVHLMPWLMERQLDRVAAQLLRQSLEARGIRFVLPAQAQAILGDASGRVSAVQLADGQSLPAQLVVMAVGIRPNTELAESARLHCSRGIVVNDTMQTFDPRIYAVGECVSHRGVAYGLVAPLFEMAKVAANHLAQFGIGRYCGSVPSTRLKVTGIDLFSAGDFQGSDGAEEIIMSDPAAGIYKKLVVKNDRLIGSVMYGDASDGAWYFKLLREGTNIARLRPQLMFGDRNLGSGGHQGLERATTITDAMEVCGCNGVCKGAIVSAIKERGLFTLEEVRKYTKASSSCGSCTGLVEQILASTIGGDYSAAPKAKPLCECTEHTHEEVRRAIRQHHLLSVAAAMKMMAWGTPGGCAKCRPALNYYVLSTWPREAADDPQSRFINERAHANIQKNGTFSVVPRMWGGSTSSAELRRIADVVDKYHIPTVKVTGGQRIDLLGVRKQDLPAVWRDLDMPSGHAYAKALRTVKTCVGSEWCRFGVQDSTRMGIELERALWRMYAPHKVKLAVSGCPRNCAEAGIKDVGVVAVESGWEIYVAGNGGIKTEVAQFFAKVATREEVLEYAGAFLQLYREDGYYLERTVHFVARVGLGYCRAKIIDSRENRAALYARLQFALHEEPDPWKERVAGVGRHEFEPLHVT